MPFDAIFQMVAALLIFPLLVVAGRDDRAGARMSALLPWIGAASYPIYILHYPLVRGIGTIAVAKLDPAHLWLVIPFEVAFAGLVGYLALIWFDIPVRRRIAAWRKSRTS